MSACPGVSIDEVKPARVLAIDDELTLDLDHGRAVRLSGLEIPLEFATAARALLAQLSLQKRVWLMREKPAQDRYGRILAQVFAEEKDERIWIEGRLLDEGLARVATLKTGRACARDLLERENRARLSKKGLWANPAYAVRTVTQLRRGDLGQFVIVEGRVLSVSQRKDRVYLNFGADYRTDFTAEIDNSDLTDFADEGYDLGALQGQVVRLRGWLDQRNGYLLKLTHPEQIERIGAVIQGWRTKGGDLQ